MNLHGQDLSILVNMHKRGRHPLNNYAGIMCDMTHICSATLRTMHSLSRVTTATRVRSSLGSFLEGDGEESDGLAIEGLD